MGGNFKVLDTANPSSIYVFHNRAKVFFEEKRIRGKSFHT
jgi:hypothetical protein